VFAGPPKRFNKKPAVVNRLLRGVEADRLAVSQRAVKVWLKSKNPQCEAVRRETEEDWG